MIAARGFLPPPEPWRTPYPIAELEWDDTLDGESREVRCDLIPPGVPSRVELMVVEPADAVLPALTPPIPPVPKPRSLGWCTPPCWGHWR